MDRGTLRTALTVNRVLRRTPHAAPNDAPSTGLAKANWKQSEGQYQKIAEDFATENQKNRSVECEAHFTMRGYSRGTAYHRFDKHATEKTRRRQNRVGKPEDNGG